MKLQTFSKLFSNFFELFEVEIPNKTVSKVTNSLYINNFTADKGNCPGIRTILDRLPKYIKIFTKFVGMVSLWQIFWVFAKIGTFTIGGGYAMIPIIEQELKKRGWVDESEIDDVIVLAQSAPGLLAVNMAIFSGYKIRGLKGSIAATVGAVLPSFVIILAIAMVFTSFKDNAVVQSVFQGIRPVAIALILVPAVNMAKKGNKTWWAWALTFVTAFLVSFLKVSAIWILLVLISSGIVIELVKEGRHKKKC